MFDTTLLVSDPAIRALSNHVNSLSLESMYFRLRDCGGVKVTQEMTGLVSMFHDAGYDSYITGYCFAKMLHYFALYEISKYINRLYSHKSVYYINLQGEDELPVDVIYHINLIDVSLCCNIIKRQKARRNEDRINEV